MGNGTSSQLEKELGASFPEGEHYFGFENKNNICYSNVVLQALYYCEEFRRQLMNVRDLKNLGDDKYGNPFALLQELFGQILNSKKRVGVCSTKKLMNYARKKNDMFEGDDHQDTHEFLIWLLNDMNDLLTKEMKKGLPGSPTAASQQAVRTWIQDIFEGKFTTRTKCLNCNTVTLREEPFLDLSVDVENHKSLTYSIKALSLPETLKDANKFFCDTCKALQEAEKRVLITHSPKTLIVHLKRFKYSDHMRRMVKLNDQVAFGWEIQVPNIDADGNNKPKLYSLNTIIVHIGPGFQVGHYIALIKSKDKWLKFDDEEINVYDERGIALFFGNFHPTACAYMLIYQEKPQETKIY